MRFTALSGALTLLGLAACSAGPESYATMTTGVGFGDYQRYMQQQSVRTQSGAPYSVAPETRTASTAATPAPANSAASRRVAVTPAPAQQPVVAARPLSAPTAQSQITSQPLAAPMRATAPVQSAPAQTAAPQTAPVQTAAVQQQTRVAAASPATNTGVRTVQAGAAFGTTPAFDSGPSIRPQISDEQDFQAVSSRESIESDRQRIARQREQYQVIEVTSVPAPSASGGPNIVAFALGTTHALGTQAYRRMNPLRWSRWESACLQYRNQDAAQEAFLAAGGPTRDRNNLDPDGDGFACWWDPTPMRQAMASN